MSLMIDVIDCDTVNVDILITVDSSSMVEPYVHCDSQDSCDVFKYV
jgi:hypothetical protein